jgi:molybdopterin synthase catalytic subunit
MAIATAVARASTGGLATFTGLVRDQNAGRRVRWIDYEAHAPLARTVFARIAAEARERWPECDITIHHRIGRVAVGEASVVIAAASPHRAGAFSACRFAIERVKQIAPVWKHEHFEDGAVWVEGAVADPEDEAALRAAVERACS